MIRSAIKKFVKEKIYNKYLNWKGSFTYFGEKVFFHKGSIAFDYMKNGVYEWDNLRFILGNIRENSTYFDVGANIGLMSLPVLKQFKDVKVVSIEASPTTFEYLNSTRNISSIKDKWQLINRAISDTAGTEIDFYTASSKNNAYQSMKNTARVDFSEIIKIVTITIDEIWNDLKQPDVSFIKSDVEGADLLAIKGGKSCIAKCKPAILLEWNSLNIVPFGFKNEDLLNLCKDIDYQCYALPAINKITTQFELFQNGLTTESYLLLPNKR